MSEELLQRIIKLENRIKAIEDGSSREPEQSVNSSSKPSIREFLIEKSPSDDVKKTIAIGYYLEHFEGLDSFNIKDLEKGFERAREKKPLNMNDKVNMAIRNGFLDEVAEKKESRKAWHITNTGISFVESNFQK